MRIQAERAPRLSKLLKVVIHSIKFFGVAHECLECLLNTAERGPRRAKVLEPLKSFFSVAFAHGFLESFKVAKAVLLFHLFFP